MSQNGKGSKSRPLSVDYNTWSKNWDTIFNNIDTDHGVKVIIHSLSTEDKCIYGYITRRMNVDLYEIWQPATNEIYLLDRSEFTEIIK